MKGKAKKERNESGEAMKGISKDATDNIGATKSEIAVRKRASDSSILRRRRTWHILPQTKAHKIKATEKIIKAT